MRFRPTTAKKKANESDITTWGSWFALPVTAHACMSAWAVFQLLAPAIGYSPPKYYLSLLDLRGTTWAFYTCFYGRARRLRLETLHL
jgi:hypothetical protein